MSFLEGFASGLSNTLGEKLGGKAKGFVSNMINPNDNKSFIPSIKEAISGREAPTAGDGIGIPTAPDGYQATPEHQELAGRFSQGMSSLASAFPEAWKVAQAIAVHESGGNYKAIGPQVHNENAYGKYQIMKSNIGPWSKEALGQAVSKDEFYKNPDLQDRVAVYKMNALLQKGYTPQDVASIWFTGRPQKGNNSKDLATGQHVNTYVDNFNKAYFSGKF